MKRIVLITGGARSGKSDYAIGVVDTGSYRNRYFIATAEPLDEEMRERIEKHRNQRSQEWTTLEEPIRIWDKLQGIDSPGTVAILDCLTLWVSNLMSKGDVPAVQEGFGKLLQTLKGLRHLTVYIVTNEVGMGIVPADKTTRLYRDLLGQLNRSIASLADEVYLLVSGIALKLK